MVYFSNYPTCAECRDFQFQPVACEFVKINGERIRRDDPELCGSEAPEPPACEVCPKAEADLKDGDLSEQNQATVEHYWRIQALGATDEDRADYWVRRQAPVIHQMAKEADRVKTMQDQNQSMSGLVQATFGGLKL